MKVFVYSPDTASAVPFQIALRRDGLDSTKRRHFIEQMCFLDRQSHAATWKSPPMQLRWDDYEAAETAEACDFPIANDSGAIVMSEHAKKALMPFLNPYGELLPLDCHEGSFWILNVTHIVDALDSERSEWAPVPGESPMLWREAFLTEKIADSALFRLPPSWKKSRTYFTQLFLDEIVRHGLTGLHGREIWDSEKGIVT